MKENSAMAFIQVKNQDRLHYNCTELHNSQRYNGQLSGYKRYKSQKVVFNIFWLPTFSLFFLFHFDVSFKKILFV